MFDCECAYFSAFVYLFFWCILESTFTVCVCIQVWSCNQLTFSDLISHSCI